MDMTTGSPFKKILIFSLPIAFGLMFQNLYTLGDSLIVSLSRGQNAVTGLNLTESLSFLILGFGSGIAAGFGILLSQYVGAKNADKMRQSFATSIMLTIAVSVVMTVLTVLLAPTLLRILNTNELYFDHALAYITTIFAGFGGIMFYNLSAQILRALGDSTTPLIILVIIFKKHPALRLKKTDFRFSLSFAWRHLATGLPMGFQFTITAIGCMIQQRAFNSLPDSGYAMAQSTACKIDNVFSSLLMGAANTMAIYVGQNFGANNLQRVKDGIKAALLVGVIYSLLAFGLILPLCVPFGKILLKGSEDKIYGWIFQYILTQSSFYYFVYVLMMFRQSLQSLGYSALTVFGGVTELLFRLFAAMVLATNFGFTGACFSNPCAWIGGAVFFTVAYLVIIKKLEKKSQTGNIFEQ